MATDAVRHLLTTFTWLLLMMTVDSVAAVPVSTDAQALMYLDRFGYLDPAVKNPTSGALMSIDALNKAITEFQAFAGLKQTGVLDSETLKWMSRPRCGVKDKVGSSDTARKKRYALQGSRWRVKELTYTISKYPSGLRQPDVDRELSRAFQVWADVTELTFEHRKSGKVHIEIRFESGEHGDGDPFDGAGGTLAHAYFPIYGGDAHFDDAETWTINSYKGTNLFQVAAHEFGHSLGLSHSDVRAALMAPFYRGYESTFQLDDDDISAIQSLYGKKSTPGGGVTYKPLPVPPITPSSGSRPSNHDLCLDGKIDTIFSGPDSNTYVFRGDKYWKLDGDNVAIGYPRLIRSDWAGLPNDIDAAFTWTNGRTYFFKGSKYWRFTNFKADAEYPKELSEGFAGVPSNVDTAFVWSGNGKIYFFKGSKYWRFDPTQKPPIKSTYPKDISNWEGLPNDLDAAFQFTNGYSYFFKNGLYWRFNDRSFKVDEGMPSYPRPAGKWWFGCSDAVKGKAVTHGNIQAADQPHAHDRDADLLDAGFSQLDGDTRVNSIAREALHKDVKSSSETISSSSTKLNSHLVGTFFMIIIVRLISRF